MAKRERNEADLPQILQTSVRDRATGITAYIVFVPADLVDDFELPRVPYRSEASVNGAIVQLRLLIKSDITRPLTEPETDTFIYRLITEEIVPVKASPIKGEAIAKIMVAAAEVGPPALAGTIAVLDAAYGSHYLMITVPIGIVLIGVTSAFANWFADNGDRIFDRMFGSLLTAPQRRPSIKRSTRAKGASKRVSKSATKRVAHKNATKKAGKPKTGRGRRK